MHAEVRKYADWPDSRGRTWSFPEPCAHAFVHLALAIRILATCRQRLKPVRQTIRSIRNGNLLSDS